MASQRQGAVRRSGVMATAVVAFLARAGAQEPEPRHYEDGVVAVVEGEPITRRDLELACRLVDEYRKLGPQDEARRFALQSEQLKLLVQERVLLLKAGEQSLQLAPDDEERVQAALARQAEPLGGLDGLRQALEELGVPYDAFVRRKREDAVIQKLLVRSISQDIFISPDEIRRYYEAHASRFETKGETRVQQVVVYQDPEASPRDPPPPLLERFRREHPQWDPRAYAEFLLAQVRAGTPFEQVALSGSMGSDFDRTHVFGRLRRPEDVLVPPLGAAVNALRPGQVSEVIAAPSGTFHLLYLAERREAGHLSLGEVQEEIERTLREEVWNRRLQQWIERQVDEAYVRTYLRPR